MKNLLSLADTDNEAIELWDNLRLGYTETKGLPQLREELAKSYAGLDFENILTFAGSEEGIYCAMQVIILIEY